MRSNEEPRVGGRELRAQAEPPAERRMEPLWSPGLQPAAISRKRGGAENGRNKAKTVAVGCDQLLAVDRIPSGTAAVSESHLVDFAGGGRQPTLPTVSDEAAALAAPAS